MRKDGVPQDATPTYGGGRKLLYAVDERGNYGGVQSTGWETEGDATPKEKKRKKRKKKLINGGDCRDRSFAA